jgi:hypothetical protein
MKKYQGKRRTFSVLMNETVKHVDPFDPERVAYVHLTVPEPKDQGDIPAVLVYTESQKGNSILRFDTVASVQRFVTELGEKAEGLKQALVMAAEIKAEVVQRQVAEDAAKQRIKEKYTRRQAELPLDMSP